MCYYKFTINKTNIRVLSTCVVYLTFYDGFSEPKIPQK